MKIRYWLYALLAIVVAAAVFAVAWLSSHREFADPTWLDHEKALTVQAAWAQAIFSVIAIFFAILSGEVQHNRTRRQAAKEAKLRLEQEQVQTLRAASWILHSLAGEYIIRMNIVSMLQIGIELIDNKKFVQKNSHHLTEAIKGLISQQFLTSPLTMSKFDSISGLAFNDVLKAASVAERLHAEATTVIMIVASGDVSYDSLREKLFSMKNNCEKLIESIRTAEHSIMKTYSLSPVRAVES